MYHFHCQKLLLLIACSIAIVVCSLDALAQGFAQSRLSGDVYTAYDLAAADLDGDGDIDVAATGTAASALFWIENRQNLPPVTYQIGYVSGGLRGVCAADFTGDGRTDLVIGAFNANQFLLFENTGNGGEQQFVIDTIGVSTGAFNVRAADINGDGHADLVTCEYIGNRVRIWMQQNGVLNQVYAATIQTPTDAVVTDFDGDGDNDIVAASYDEGISWIERIGDNTFVTHSLGFGMYAARIAAADIDRDGDMDLAGALFNAGEVVWWEHGPTGSFNEHILSSAMLQPRGLAITDINGDQLLDIVAASQGESSVNWWQNFGNRTFILHELTLAARPQNLICSDYDLDGDQDILVADFSTNEILLYNNQLIPPAMITGVVSALSSGSPVRGVEVRLVETGLATLTDSNGVFRLFTMPDVFTVEARHPCWNTSDVENVVVGQNDTIHVDFQLVRAEIEVPVTSLNFSANNGVSTRQDFVVRNNGDGILDLRFTANGLYPQGNWLSVIPDHGTVNPDTMMSVTVQVTPDTSNSNAWDYAGKILIQSNTCPDSSGEVAVLVNVLDAPNRRSAVPRTTTLLPAFPNPFNVVSTIEFDLERDFDIQLSLYDINGRLSQSLQTGHAAAGAHRVQINGSSLASGLYLVVLRAGDKNFSQKLLLLK